MSEWKEYITVENLTLVVGIVTLLVTYLSYRYMRKSDKRNARNLLECKEAYKKELELWDKLGVGSQDIKERMAKRAILEKEIEQLNYEEYILDINEISTCAPDHILSDLTKDTDSKYGLNSKFPELSISNSDILERSKLSRTF